MNFSLSLTLSPLLLISMRLLKQLIYGFIFLIILALIVWWIVGLFYTPNPTCFDDSKNQGETGVDCGGPCISCEVKSLKDIVVNKKSIISNGDGSVGIAVELINQNAQWGASSFNYTLTLKDQFGAVVQTISDTSFIYGGELKYLVVPRIEKVDVSRVASVEVAIQNIQWVSGAQFVKPDIEIQDVRAIYDGGVIVNAKVYNKDTQSFSRVGVAALVFNRSGTLIGVAQTFLDTLPTLASQNVRVIFAKQLDIYQPIISATIQFSQNLKKGDTGEDVKNLQGILTESGMYTGAMSGFYDEDTATGVSAFQTKNNITQTGELDEKTRTFLNTVLQSGTPQQTAQEKDTSVDASRTKVFVGVSR